MPNAGPSRTHAVAVLVWRAGRPTLAGVRLELTSQQDRRWWQISPPPSPSAATAASRRRRGQDIRCGLGTMECRTTNSIVSMANGLAGHGYRPAPLAARLEP